MLRESLATAPLATPEVLLNFSAEGKIMGLCWTERHTQMLMIMMMMGAGCVRLRRGEA